ncbi:hypothetical protein [Butyricicoccus pullicaecorum]|uniref:hypothetical protein n=1 Tax=Butyricicoccus pullicaecorum TaxID=501571 RepID=UPI003990D63A
MSGFEPRGIARLRTRFFVLFWLIFAKAKIKKGISPVATGDSGRCPENPQAFRERLERKLLLRGAVVD